MLEKVKIYDYLTESWVERYEETDPSKVITGKPITYEEYLKRNFGPNAKVKEFSELSPKEQEEYLKKGEEDNENN